MADLQWVPTLCSQSTEIFSCTAKQNSINKKKFPILEKEKPSKWLSEFRHWLVSPAPQGCPHPRARSEPQSVSWLFGGGMIGGVYA